MREIKFRVWTGLNMEYRVLVGALGAFYAEGLDKKDSACLSPFNTIYPKETPIMQFTGLFDKNGKKIWEGDIVRLDSFDNPSEFEVRFIEGAFCLWNEAVPYSTDIHYVQHAGIKQAEVIGNIYENPELLRR